jgi:CRP-like cAMP-binding protein
VSPLIRKLECGAPLSDLDRAAIARAVADRRQAGPREDLIRQGDRPHAMHGVLSGIACRYKTLPEGERQIVGLMVPGDFCDVHFHILGTVDHSIATIGACEIALVPRHAIDRLISEHPSVARAMWWASLVDEATLREWLLSMGQRSAIQRMAHLFCELRLRMKLVGLAEDDTFDFPLTQAELSDVLGLSSVHANRTLQELRGADLITLRNNRLQIHDPAALQELAEFDPAYLHLESRQLA